MSAFIPTAPTSRPFSSSFVTSSLVPCRPKLTLVSTPAAPYFKRSRWFIPAVRSPCTRMSSTLETPSSANGSPTVATEVQTLSKSPFRDIVRGVKQLSQPLWNGDRKVVAYLWTGAVILLSFGATSYALLLSTIQRFFWNCLGAKDASKFKTLLAIYTTAVIVGPIVLSLFSWVKARLSLMWRATLTNELLNRYFSSLNYYKLSLNSSDIDNPDQRISDDITRFTSRAVRFITIFGVGFFDFIVFSIMLYRIYAPLFYVLIAYALIGTFVIIYTGRNLLRLNRQQIAREADFRFGLVRVRETTESIAFYSGEQSEKNEILSRFNSVFRNNILLLGLSRTVEFSSTAFRYFAQVVPLAIIAPKYFAGVIKLGVISQVFFSFNHVLSSLGLVIQEFSALSEFGAGVRRLQTLMEALPQMDDRSTTAKSTAKVVTQIHDCQDKCHIALRDVTVTTPSDPPRVLAQNIDAFVAQGERLLIIGPSGVGKSSLMRVVCGLWDSGTGLVERPPTDRTLFLPQRPFIMLGSLRENVIYPSLRTDVSDTEVLEALRAVNLGYLTSAVGGLDASGEILSRKLSLGEQQRLAFARIVISKPQVVILDESSSALDLQNERSMYSLVQDLGLTCISVGNRPSLLNFHDRVLRLNSDGSWEMSGVDEAKRQHSESLFV